MLDRDRSAIVDNSNNSTTTYFSRMLARLFVGLLLVASVSAWGWQGHDIVGRIAEGLLTPAAQKQVDQILQNDQCGPSAPCQYGSTLSGCASWADEVKAEAEWLWTRPVHYVDTPDSKDLRSCSYEYKRDCFDHTYDVGAPDLCVTGGINNSTNQLKTSLTSLNTTVDAACALKFLVHYVGDVHQPLHVGFTSDRGGNLESVTWFGEASHGGYPHILHGLWDFDIIERFLNETYPKQGFKGWESWAEDLGKDITPTDKKRWGCSGDLPTCVDTWASESIALACSNSYVTADGKDFAFTNGTALAGPYYERNIDVVNEQLRKGGYRLASIINTLFQ